MFHTADQFPAAEAIDLPLSLNAHEFYKTKLHFLERHLSLWLAVLVAELLALLIPLLAVLYPIFRFAPIIYDRLERGRVYKFHSELRKIEDEMFSSSTRRPQKTRRESHSERPENSMCGLQPSATQIEHLHENCKCRCEVHVAF